MCRKALVVCVLAMLLGRLPVSAVQYAYMVSFADKNGTAFSLATPSAYLSARAIARRTAQGIAIDSTDLPVNSAYIDSVLALTGGELHEVSRWQNLCVVLVPDSSVMHRLDGKAFIRGTKLAGYYSTMLHRAAGTAATGTPATAHKASAGDAVYYGDTWVQTALVNGSYLHDAGYNGEGKMIAVLDAGFTGTDTHYGFDSLRISGRIADVHNFTLASGNVYNYDTHGTGVLSTMAGYVPDTFVGSAPLATYVLYVTEDGTSEQPIELINMLCAAERADSIGADIITTSLGYNTFDNPADNFNFSTDFDGKTTIAARAANTATSKGMLFVASAGNEGGDAWNRILTPGDADSALTIGSVDYTGTNAPNSGYGPNAAGQVKPDVCALGYPANIFSESGYYTANGTSFSTPQVSGWAACLWQANPAATSYLLRLTIDRCASQYATPGTQIGYGIPDFGCTARALNVKDTPVPQTAAWVTIASNPVHSVITIAVSPSVAGIAHFILTDMAGRQVAASQLTLSNRTNPVATIDVQQLPAGIYLLHATSAGQSMVLKVVKE